MWNAGLLEQSNISLCGMQELSAVMPLKQIRMSNVDMPRDVQYSGRIPHAQAYRPPQTSQMKIKDLGDHFI